MTLEDVDEALLLANALVELKTSKRGESTKVETIRIELLQKCIDYIIADASSVKHIDQIVILLNTLMSDTVLSGSIDLISSSSCNDA